MGFRFMRPAGSLRAGPWDVELGPEPPEWQRAGLRVARLDDSLELPGEGLERLVVPLAGAVDVETPDGRRRLDGRRSPFDGPTDVLYAGSGTPLRLSGPGARIAVAEAPAEHALPTTVIPRTAIPIELRGAGRASRQVHDLGVPGVLDAESLIVCEVVTPAGNWSSYPPHRHDRVSSTETALEEVYYFEAAPRRGGDGSSVEDPFGLFTAYPSDDRPIDVAARVRTGDVALVPWGFHGPAAAAPDYDLYYLNVMAGPDRAWRITDDPRHEHVRAAWRTQAVDARLPYRSRGTSDD